MLFLVQMLAPLGLSTMSPMADESFTREVAPLLERSCIGCHGPSKAKAGLSLETREAWLAGSRHGAVVVPGDASASPLLELLVGDPPEMPAKGAALSSKEVRVLSDWIDRGLPWSEGVVLGEAAPDEDFWSLRALERPPVPVVDGAENPIDAFVRSALADKQLEPSPEADRRVLARRLWLNLTGLPPSFEEVEDFIADPDDQAFADRVDALLASPRYAERFARHWLDVAHYADTHGYDKDKRRAYAWPYRDWVIDAFDRDLPWSEFAELQLAGDVLRPHDPDAVAATGFVVAGPWDFVGHVELREGTHDKRVTRNLDRDDMVANAMSAFASTTVHCARCHDHRFDPITQRDYYSLQAVFAGVERANRVVDRDPAVGERRGELQALLESLRRERETLRARSASPSNGWHSEVSASPDAVKWVQVDLGAPRRIERVVLVPARPVDFADSPGFGFPRRFRVETSLTPDFNGTHVLASHHTQEFPNPGDTALTIAAGPNLVRYVRVTATELWERSDDWVFALAELQVFDGQENLARDAEVSALDSIEAGLWGRSRLVDGYSSRASLEHPADKAASESLAHLEGTLTHLETELSSLAPPTKIYAPVPREPRPIHLLARGDVETPLEPATPGALLAVQALSPRFEADSNEGARRLALARWLIDEDNPLFWRSAANRLWSWNFGRPLVDTPNDFGRMGAEPSHPELLDWLACELRDGATPKTLVRLMVTSETWRQSSAHEANNAKLDASNRYLWRANRRRLSAEEIRDSSLWLSGELDVTMGGPGFEAFAFENDESPRYLYAERDVNEPSTFRRSVYRLIVRSVPDPWMQTLDCADPSSSVPLRGETTTPLQALAMLNDRFLLERAASLAGRAGSVDAAFRSVLSREPDADERQALAAHARAHGLASATRVLLNLAEFLYVD